MRQWPYVLVLLSMFACSCVLGALSRSESPQPVVRSAPDPTLAPTAKYEWGELEIEPFLYAPPLGSFVPYSDMSVFEYPSSSAPVVDNVGSGDYSEYTSEYNFEDQQWLCVRWIVGEKTISWSCTGWILSANSSGVLGELKRFREYSPDPIESNQGA